MKRTFFIVVLAIFFTFDIFFAISSAVADNLKGSPNAEIVRPSESTIIENIIDKKAPDHFYRTENASQP